MEEDSKLVEKPDDVPKTVNNDSLLPGKAKLDDDDEETLPYTCIQEKFSFEAFHSIQVDLQR